MACAKFHENLLKIDGKIDYNALLLYLVWFYHITMGFYDIDPMKNNTYFVSEKSEK